MMLDRLYFVLAVAEIGTASTPLELGVAETRLVTLCYPHPGLNTDLEPRLSRRE